jgi:hypothetical protein
MLRGGLLAVFHFAIASLREEKTQGSYITIMEYDLIK